mmetsp:Transcript_26658/g.74860  ORF Transcript_26658/g.74860 Transcript_26658/m.74860 type:complete len:139 (+) Transcript_26658:3020-3436(+)
MHGGVEGGFNDVCACRELSNNDFTGRLPKSWSSMVQMRRFVADRNAFNGNLPATWGTAWINVKEIRIMHNELEGDLPRFWNELSSLETLELAENKLDGQLPNIWSNMHSLVTMDLSQNKLAGNLPREWESSMPNLRKM